MDEAARELERKAKAGDSDAAYRWLLVATRANNYAAQYEALMIICESNNPGSIKRIKDAELTLYLLKQAQESMHGLDT